MKQKIFNFFTTLFISIFALTIIITGVVLYRDYKTGCEAAEKRFEKLVAQTEDAISLNGSPTKEFGRMFTNAVGSLEHYNSIYLKNFNREIYKFPATGSVRPSLFTKAFSRRITEGATVDLNLTVSIYTLPQDLIFSRVKIAFIIILSVTLSCILLLIYLYLSDNDKKTNSIKETKADSILDKELEDELNAPEEEINLFEEEPEAQDAEQFEDENFESSEETVFEQKKEADLNNSPDSEELSIFENQNKENFEQNEILDKPETFAGEKEEAPSLSKEDAIREVKESSVLFNNESGLTYEKNLISRLESELARSSSGELDLSLFLIRIPGFSRTDECGLEVCRLFVDLFHYKDMLFDYKDDGIAVILSNADIDTCMDSCENVYTEICSILNKYNRSQKPYIGIASRSLRFISGERILSEAEQALLHAKDDPESPIIAFRVNPEKYRQYMASQK